MNENELELTEIPELPTEDDGDEVDWKAIAEERQALATKNYGYAKRMKSKLEKSEKPKEPATTPPVPEEKGFGYAELAYLSSKGISDEDIDFVEETVKNTGKDLRNLLTAKWFQSELSERVEGRKTQQATPKPTGRTAIPAKDDVDYHVAKYREGLTKGKEILPDDPALALKVINKMQEGDAKGNKFSPHPIV